MSNIDIILNTVAGYFGITVRGLRNRDMSDLLVRSRTIAFRLIQIHEPKLLSKDHCEALNKPPYMHAHYYRHFSEWIIKPDFFTDYKNLCNLLKDLPINR